METFVALLTAITALIVSIATLLKNYLEIKKSLPKTLKDQSNINMEIIDILEEAKERFRADRIQIYDYQNGEHFMNGRSAFKVSCTYEVVRKGVKSYLKDLQKIPLLFIPKFQNYLLTNEKIYVRNINEIKETMPSTYQFKCNQEICSFYDVILKNKEGEAIGFLGIQYNDNCYTLSDDDFSDIELLKMAIEKRLEKMINK